MTTVFFVLLVVCLLGLLLFGVSFVMRRRIGLPSGDVVYADSEKAPGEILEAQSIPLVGKPDYILEKDGAHIPVEVKTGKTPKTPYKNHIAQLFAYCLLVGEHFGKRPPYGIIRYPDREFPLQYTEEAEEGLKKTIMELLQKKQSGEYRQRMQHVCRRCRDGKHGSVST